MPGQRSGLATADKIRMAGVLYRTLAMVRAVGGARSDVVVCRRRGLSIRQLALHFCMACPIDGVVLAGCGTQKHVEEIHREATSEVPLEVWREFKSEFGVGV